jgi:DDE superfamily endonuclease
VDQLTPCWRALLEPFRTCFRPEVFATFSAMTVAWIVCLGRRSISRVWETTGRSQHEDHSKAFRLFSAAAWNWDELARIACARFLALFVPGTRVWLVIDDTLCHKRGAKVAFGGFFLDAVLSSKKRKTFRFGNNWVTLGLIIQLPFRKDRSFCVNLLWRVYAKKDATKPKLHKTKPQLAFEMVCQVASWLGQQRFVVLADSGYVGKHLLKGLPANVAVIGPIHWKASLSKPLPADCTDKRRKKGADWTTPAAALADDQQWPWQEVQLQLPKGAKKMLVKEIEPCCWYASAGPLPLRVVLARDPEGKWRDEAFLSGEMGLSAAEVITGYCQRWSVEVAYCDSKQLLGLHDPLVYSEASVQKAHPMAWFVGAMVVLWYSQEGRHQEQARRHRPWYKDKVAPTMADMLACCRLYLWRHWLDREPQGRAERLEWLLEYLATAA